MRVNRTQGVSLERRMSDVIGVSVSEGGHEDQFHGTNQACLCKLV